MTAPRSKAAAKTAGATAKQTGVFARLKAEAERSQPAPEPYVIDDADPPIVITAPTDTETQIGLAELFGSAGEFDIKDARRILELVCGDSFPAVWELFRREHVSVMVALIADMSAHFGPSLNAEAASLPGGSAASSS